MYLNFVTFLGGRTSAGGDKPWSKNGDKCQMGGGGDWQNFRRMGGPPSPPQEKTLSPIPGVIDPGVINHGRNR